LTAIAEKYEMELAEANCLAKEKQSFSLLKIKE
jgi:hypothetical protein